MFCVKDSAGADQPNDIAITRHYFDAARGLMTAPHSTEAASENLGDNSAGCQGAPATAGKATVC
jgi:hypothetical protein